MSDLLVKPKRRFEQRLLLGDVTWPQYVEWLKLVGRRFRLTYDQGDLEIMTLSSLHEWLACLLGQFIEVLTAELAIPRRSAGSTTFKLRKKLKGLEPDRSYYIQNEAKVRGKDKIDLRSDPPPDLAVEVEISRSVLKRMLIYAAIGIPEIWRFDGTDIIVHVLNAEGEYEESERSLAFPFLKVKKLVRFLNLRQKADETQVVESFREWVREQKVQGWK
ncbi:MAG: Uma2 family endonuclease [Gemmataceae bacterium]|nr:Uma2 family endonuclease [Gemmataceae bacterium]MCI0742965.1 Uma2 family endonuclease [Gemmataceae bacterium]